MNLRELVKFIDKEEIPQRVYTHFEDTILEVNIESDVIGSRSSLENYRMKVERYVREHQDHITINKLKYNLPITNQDLEELERILFVPDVLFIEGNKAYLVNPLAEDTSVYSYGSDHPILEGRYQLAALRHNHIQVEGYDSGSETAMITDSFNWDEIARVYDRLKKLADRNIGSVSQAQAR